MADGKKTGEGTQEGVKYVPGARVLVGDFGAPGEVRRAYEQDGEWHYYVALDSGGAFSGTGALLRLGTLPRDA